MLGAERLNRRKVFERGVNHVKPFGKHRLVARRDGEVNDRTVLSGDGLLFEIDGELFRRVGRNGYEQTAAVGFGNAGGEKPVVKAV